MNNVNRRYMLPLLMVIMASFSLLVSCSKDDDNPASGNKSRKEILVGKTWELKNATSMGQDVTTIMSMYMNKLKFDNNGTVTVEGSMGSGSSTWVLAENDSKIVFDKGTEDESTVTIESISQSELKVNGIFESNGVPVAATATFK